MANTIRSNPSSSAWPHPIIGSPGPRTKPTSLLLHQHYTVESMEATLAKYNSHGNTCDSEDTFGPIPFRARLQPDFQSQDLPMSQCGSLTACSTIGTTLTMSSSSGRRSGSNVPEELPASPAMPSSASSVAGSIVGPDCGRSDVHSVSRHRHQSSDPTQDMPSVLARKPSVMGAPPKASETQPMSHALDGKLLPTIQTKDVMARSNSRASSSLLGDETRDEPSGELGQHTLYHLKHQLIDLLVERFHSYTAANQHGTGSGGGGNDGTQQPSRQDKQTASRKRNAVDQGDDESRDNGGASNKQPKKPKDTDADTGVRQTLDRPFSKKEPVRHRGCYRYKLKRVRDVKQVSHPTPMTSTRRVY